MKQNDQNIRNQIQKLSKDLKKHIKIINFNIYLKK